MLRDIGVWSHYLADASQPLQVSIHFDGWGDFPKPEGFTNSKKLHAHFEGEFVKKNLQRVALFIIARYSSFSYKGKSPDVRQVGRELGVRYALEGSIRLFAKRCSWPPRASIWTTHLATR